jgi:hypothetical protein
VAIIARGTLDVATLSGAASGGGEYLLLLFLILLWLV